MSLKETKDLKAYNNAKSGKKYTYTSYITTTINMKCINSSY